jgi:hypothetical protein
MRVTLSYEEQILNALMRIPAPSRHPNAIAYMTAQADAIRAVLAPLMADVARIDWLEEYADDIDWLRPNSDPSVVQMLYSKGPGQQGHVDGYSLREAVDAAMKEGAA